MEKLIKGEIRGRARTRQAQARLFSDQIEAVRRRYGLRRPRTRRAPVALPS